MDVGMGMGEWKAGGLDGVWLNCCCNGWAARIGNGNGNGNGGGGGGTNSCAWILALGRRKTASSGLAEWRTSCHMYAIHHSRRITRIAIATPIHAYHNDLPPTARGHRAVEHRHRLHGGASPRHLVTSSASAPFVIPGPWALRFGFDFGFGFAATPPKLHQTAPSRASHACTQHAEQATPVRTKVTARLQPRPITASHHSRVPELSRRAAACV